jgi:hypothetical protein
VHRWDWWRNQLPLLAVLLVSGSGLVAVSLHYWRKGLYVIGAGVALGSVLRLLLPTRRVGLLAVRGRTRDVLALGVLGLSIIVVAAVVPAVHALPTP